MLIAGAGVTSGLFFAGERQFFMLGETSRGHALLEPSCASCHDGWSTTPSSRCVACHQVDLADDIHPARLFANTERWSAELARLDARDCVTCHREHRPAPLGFTGSPSMCGVCHASIGTDHPSHAGFAIGECVRCHNYHHEGVIAKREAADLLDGAPLLESPLVRAIGGPIAVSPASGDAPPWLQDPKLEGEWQASAHARSAEPVNCSGCHASSEPGAPWTRAPGEERCSKCHPVQLQSFHQGKHGILPAAGLGSLSPRHEQVRLEMKADAPLQLGCGSCHSVHRLDRQNAQGAACLACHADPHTQSYSSSPHGKAFAAGRLDAPSCATCHLPSREVEDPDGKGGMQQVTWHNNSFTLRPAERMLGVCVRCHGLEHAWNSLSDEAEVRANFVGKAGPNLTVRRYLDLVRKAAAADEEPSPR